MRNKKAKQTCMDAAIALILLLFYGFVCLLHIKYVPNAYRRISYFTISLLFYGLLLCILCLRKQSIIDIGIRLEIVPITYIGIITVTLAAYSILLDKPEVCLEWLFYLFVVGGLEELIMRGFAYSRMKALLGNKVITIMILGTLDGVFHSFMPIIRNDFPISEIFNYIGGGIFGYCLFLMVYVRTGNILNAVILHASLDSSKEAPVLMPISIVYIIAILIYKRKQKIKQLD